MCGTQNGRGRTKIPRELESTPFSCPRSAPGLHDENHCSKASVALEERAFRTSRLSILATLCWIFLCQVTFAPRNYSLFFLESPLISWRNGRLAGVRSSALAASGSKTKPAASQTRQQQRATAASVTDSLHDQPLGLQHSLLHHNEIHEPCLVWGRGLLVSQQCRPSLPPGGVTSLLLLETSCTCGEGGLKTLMTRRMR